MICPDFRWDRAQLCRHVRRPEEPSEVRILLIMIKSDWLTDVSDCFHRFAIAPTMTGSGPMIPPGACPSCT